MSWLWTRKEDGACEGLREFRVREFRPCVCIVLVSLGLRDPHVARKVLVRVALLEVTSLVKVTTTMLSPIPTQSRGLSLLLLTLRLPCWRSRRLLRWLMLWRGRDYLCRRDNGTYGSRVGSVVVRDIARRVRHDVGAALVAISALVTSSYTLPFTAGRLINLPQDDSIAHEPELAKA